MQYRFKLSISIIFGILLFSFIQMAQSTLNQDQNRQLYIIDEATYGDAEVEYMYAMIAGSDGGYLMVGHTNSYGAGLVDAWIIKIDDHGNLQWNQTMGGLEDDVTFLAIPTADKGYAILGVTQSYGKGNLDGWLIKITQTGTIEWNRTYGGLENENLRFGTITPDGGFLLTGYTESNALGGRDGILIKTDSQGYMEWNRTYGGYNREYFNSVQITPEGDYILFGVKETMLIGSQDLFILKTNSEGDQLWNRTVGGSNTDIVEAVVSTSDDSYILTGRTQSYGAGNLDVWLLKIDKNGEPLWNFTFGGPQLDYASTIIQTSDGGFALGGRTASFGEGGEDMWLIKTNSSGHVEFNQTFGGEYADVAYGIVENENQGYALTGRTNSFGEGETDVWFLNTSFDNPRNLINGYPILVLLPLIGLITVTRFKKLK